MRSVPELPTVSPVRPRWLPSAAVLLAANSMPFVGVLAFHWSVFSILFLYWCENVVVGVMNVLRMLAARPQDPLGWAAKLGMVPFFIIHYGMFTMGHGLFVLAVFGRGSLGDFPTPVNVLAAIRQEQLQFALLALVVSHGVSFVHNFIMGGEYRRATLETLMFQPYARVMILHVTILVGGFIAQEMHQPMAVLLLLVLLKTGVDLAAHVKERKKLGVVEAPHTREARRAAAG